MNLKFVALGAIIAFLIKAIFVLLTVCQNGA